MRMEQENQMEQNQQVAQEKESNSESPKTYSAEEYEELADFASSYLGHPRKGDDDL